jgi:hypothetical protein
LANYTLPGLKEGSCTLLFFEVIDNPTLQQDLHLTPTQAMPAGDIRIFREVADVYVIA